MGNSNQNYAKKQKIISVISLNYSGILLSPFQFFSKQTPQMTKTQANISAIYKILLKKAHPQFNENKKENKFKWNLGKIDQKMQKQRYSPLYNKTAGIQKNRIQSQQQFRQSWLKVFDQNIQNFKQKDPTFKYTQQQKKQALEFDTLCYKAILSQVYKQFKDFSAKQVADLNPQKYAHFMNIMFGKTFLNEQKKLQKTIEAMKKQKIDIVFAQQANQSLVKRLQQIPDYKIYRRQGTQSIIIVRRQKFHNFYNSKGKYPLSHLPEIQKQLIWNNDTIVAFVDNLILISGHLSSKKQKNPLQVYEMMQSLKKLHAIYPMCHIIVGCDANSFVPDTYVDFCKQNKIYCTCLEKKIKSQIPSDKIISQIGSIESIKLQESKLITAQCQCFKPADFQIYPNNKLDFTTSKQRTYLQPQINKAQETARVCRDHLLIFKAEDISVDKAQVCTINNKSPSNVQNLPCQQHPYDHYVVKGFITVNVMTHFGKNYDDGK